MKKLFLISSLLLASAHLSASNYLNNEIPIIEITGSISNNNLPANAKVFLAFETTHKSVDGNDALNMLKNELNNLTNFVIVDSIEEADFIIYLRVEKQGISGRKAKFTISNNQTEEIVFDSKFEKGNPTHYNGFSGSRQSIGRVIKRQLRKEFPQISKKN